MATDYIDLDAMAEEAANFEPPAAGEYRAVCVETEVKITSTNKRMIKAEYNIKGGPEDGKKLWNQYVNPIGAKNEPVAKRYFIMGLQAHGITPTGRPDWHDLARRMIGAEVIVKVKRGEWNDQPTANVTSIRKAKPITPGGTPIPAKPGVKPPLIPTALGG